MFRRLTAIAVSFGLLAAPSVARSELVCRYTGQVIAGCDEGQVPVQPTARNAGCCERRAIGPLDAARIVHAEPGFAPIRVAVPTAPLDVEPALPSRPARSTPAVGPPIFIAIRTLLI